MARYIWRYRAVMLSVCVCHLLLIFPVFKRSIYANRTSFCFHIQNNRLFMWDLINQLENKSNENRRKKTVLKIKRWSDGSMHILLMFPFAVWNLSSDAKALNGFSFQLFSFRFRRWFLAIDLDFSLNWYEPKIQSFARAVSVSVSVCSSAVHACLVLIVFSLFTVLPFSYSPIIIVCSAHYVHIKHGLPLFPLYEMLMSNEQMKLIRMTQLHNIYIHNRYVWALSARHFQ